MSALIFVSRVNNASLVYMVTFILVSKEFSLCITCSPPSLITYICIPLHVQYESGARGIGMITAPCTSGYYNRVMAFVFVVNTRSIVECRTP